jgi:hypothetical protein
MRANVDALEAEYERTSQPMILETLRTAKVRLGKHTSKLQRQVADQLVNVRELLSCLPLFTLPHLTSCLLNFFLLQLLPLFYS